MAGVTVYNSQYPDGHEQGSIDFRDVAKWIEHDGTWAEFVLLVRQAIEEEVASIDGILPYVFDSHILTSRIFFQACRDRLATALVEIEKCVAVEDRKDKQ